MNWLTSFFNISWKGIQFVAGVLRNTWCLTVFLFTGVLEIVKVLWDRMLDIFPMIVKAVSAIGSFSGNIDDYTYHSLPSDILATVNVFVPLDHMAYILVTLITLRSAVIVYRVIKSWIPTLSG